MAKKRSIVLTIAGFDPSGGAGVLSDIKTFEQTNSLGMAVVTANTIQTEDTFQSVNWVEKKLILAQLSLLLEHYTFEWIKIGLIENLEVLNEVIQLIKRHNSNAKIVWDPIIGASAGGVFDVSRFDNWQSIVKDLYAITPNIPEYKQLFKTELPEKIAQENEVFIYLKGGHAIEKGTDNLYTPSGKHYTLKAKQVTDLEKHGTGCIFSAAWISYAVNDFAPLKSAVRAKSYVEKRIVSNNTKLAYHR